MFVYFSLLKIKLIKIEYLNNFYGQQYINQLYNPSEEMVILEPEEVTKNIMDLVKLKFVKFTLYNLFFFPKNLI